MNYNIIFQILNRENSLELQKDWRSTVHFNSIRNTNRRMDIGCPEISHVPHI